MVMIEKVAHKGWPNCQKISNDLVELIVTTDVGPRIYHFGFKGGENQFYENPADFGSMGGDKWHNYGGHRLWHAPEDVVRTYYPDTQPVQVKVLKDGARFTAATESNGVQKIIEVHLSETEAKVKVNHILINHNLWTIPLSVWALSVMKAGGKVIVPFSPRIGHDDQLTPNGSLALWGYTKMDDPRWTWCEKYFMLKQDSSLNYCQKIGSMDVNGWAACYNKGNLFVKKFGYNPALVYPDFNCNFETYTDQNILEIETLGPMVQLEPGQKAEHLEEWSLFKGVKEINNDADADRYLLPLLK
jgi:hypothetical protein